MKTPDRNDLKLGRIVVLDSLSKRIDLVSKGQGSGARVIIWNFWRPSYLWDECSYKVQILCTGGYCLRIKNYTGMRQVAQNIINSL